MPLFARDNTPRITDAQKEYIENLLEKTGIDFDEIVADELARDVDSLEDLTLEEASIVIEYLKEC